MSASMAAGDGITSSRTVQIDGAHWFIELHTKSAGLALAVKERLFIGHSPFQRIEVFQTEEYGRMLALDGLIMLTERDESVYHEMMVHVPLLSHRQPKRVLIIGGGDGGTLREVAKHAGVERVTQVEIDGQVVEVCKQFFPSVAVAYDDSRLNLVIEDAVKFVRATDQRFDAIIIDSSDPVGPAVELINQDFYRDAGRILDQGGVLTVQIGSPFYDLDRVKTVMGRLRACFERVRLYLANIPSYPSGCWGIGFATNDKLVEKNFDEVRYNTILPHLKYYNSEVHRGAFILPEYLQRALRGN